VQVMEGPSGFDVKQNGAEIWNSSFADNYSALWPPQSYSWVTLQPGQSYTQTATWNGVPDQLPSGDLSGTFTVSNELDPRAETATFQILSTPYPAPSNPPPSNPNPQPTTLTSPTPIVVTISTAHTHKLGQTVPLSLNLKNVSAEKVAVSQSPKIETVTVKQGSTLVYESVRKAHALPSRMIIAGHRLKLTTAWSGKANQVGVDKLKSGAYTITVSDDGYMASTTVQLIARRS
jgi:hypothetical protein